MKKIFLLLLMCIFIAKAVDAKRYIATQDIKVRNGRGNKFDTLGTIKKGTIIVTNETKGKWRKVQDEDEVGYVSEAFLDDAPPEVNEPKDTSVNATIKEWVNNNKLIALGALIAVLLVLRSAALAMSARKSEKVATDFEDKYKSLVKYWYQCKHCGAAIKNDTEPRTNGCNKSLHHLWFQLAEVGQHKYHCKNCNVTINAKNDPTDHGCPSSALHRWEKKR